MNIKKKNEEFNIILKTDPIQTHFSFEDIEAYIENLSNGNTTIIPVTSSNFSEIINENIIEITSAQVSGNYVKGDSELYIVDNSNEIYSGLLIYFDDIENETYEIYKKEDNLIELKLPLKRNISNGTLIKKSKHTGKYILKMSISEVGEYAIYITVKNSYPNITNIMAKVKIVDFDIIDVYKKIDRMDSKIIPNNKIEI